MGWRASHIAVWRCLLGLTCTALLQRTAHAEVTVLTPTGEEEYSELLFRTLSYTLGAPHLNPHMNLTFFNYSNAQDLAARSEIISRGTAQSFRKSHLQLLTLVHLARF